MDIKKLIVETLKEEGLDIGEEAAALVVKGVFSAVTKIVIASENKFDDLLLAVLPIVEPQIMKLIDKIDGKDDEGR